MRYSASRLAPTPATSRRAALLAAVIAASTCTLAVAVEPVFWRQRVFFIPYQPAADAPPIDKVQLLVARNGAGEWAVLQEAEPHVRGFSYHAPADGDYSFAVRTMDRQGNLSPTIIAQPQLRVVVDTAPPAIELGAALDATGQVVARYEARDVQLRPETLRIEVQTDRGAWERIATGPPDVSQPDRVAGQLTWKPPPVAAKLRFRAMIEDRAGNQYAATAETSLIGPMLSQPDVGPSLSPPMMGSDSVASGPSLRSALGEAPPLLTASPLANAQNLSEPAAPPVRPGIEWPAQSGVATANLSSPTPDTSTSQAVPVSPPLWPEQRTPAQLVADRGEAPKQTSVTPGIANPFSPPPLLSDSTSEADRLVPLPPIGANSARNTPAPVANQPAASVRWVNSTTFDVDYDVQTVGPWGVSKIELWATRDGGREWVSFGPDADNRSPIRVTVPGAGVYGFRLVVNGANGAPAPTPLSGDQPELVIGVDLQEPQGDLQAAEIGQGNLADHLLIRWTAADENLEDRPVGLFYGAEPQGPWSTIATDIDNTGQYAWRLLRQVPEKLYLRLEIRDRAGNVAVRVSPAPVVLNLPQPTGRLRSVRPVQEDASRFRTAAGRAAMQNIQ